MTIVFSPQTNTPLRPNPISKIIFGTKMKLAAITLCLGSAVIGSVEVTRESSRLSALTSAVAAGDEVVRRDGKVYAIQCTDPGQANAFRIGIDRDGNKVVTEDALVNPQWPYDHFYGHSVPAERCNS
jgi:hypothetical protein